MFNQLKYYKVCYMKKYRANLRNKKPQHKSMRGKTSKLLTNVKSQIVIEYQLRKRKIKNDKHYYAKGQPSRCCYRKSKSIIAPIKRNKAIKKLDRPKRNVKTDWKKQNPSNIGQILSQGSKNKKATKSSTSISKVVIQKQKSTHSSTQDEVTFKHLSHPSAVSQQLNLNSAAYIVCDSEMNIIVSKNMNKSYYIASITKLVNLMTCLQIIKQFKISMQEMFQVPKLCIKRTESSAKIREGETISLMNLINAMIIPSGNDAAETIAIVLGKYLGKYQTIQQSKKAYISRMKQYALKIGMKQTRLKDEKGFALNSSTPSQVARILHRVVQNELAFSFLKKSVVRGQVLDITKKQRSYTWTSTNLLFSEGFYGKTSHSIDGSFGLAAAKTYKDKTFYICVLGSASESGRFSDVKYLFNNVIKKVSRSQ